MNNKTEEFAHSIALEAQALEQAVSQGTLDYYSTSVKLGKSWYSVGLESTDSDTKKDGKEKLGVVKRMVEAIMAFIRRIVDHIKKFLGGRGKDAKAREEGLKHLKGPTDEQLAKVVDNVIRQAKSGEAAAAAHAATAINKAKDSSAQAAKQQGDVVVAEKVISKDVLETAFARAEGYLGKKFTRKEAVEKFFEEKTEAIEKNLGAERLVLFCVSLDQDFHNSYSSAMTLAKKISKTPIEQLDGMQDDIADLMRSVATCNTEAKEGSKNDDVLMKFVYGLNNSLLGRAITYAQATYWLDDLTKYLEGLQGHVDKLKSDGSEESVQKLQLVQKVLSDMTAYLGLCTRLDTVHKIAYDVLTA